MKRFDINYPVTRVTISQFFGVWISYFTILNWPSLLNTLRFKVSFIACIVY